MKKTVSPIKREINNYKRGLSKIGKVLWESFKREEQRHANIAFFPENGGKGVYLSSSSTIKIIKDVAIRILLTKNLDNKAGNVIPLNQYEKKISDLIYNIALQWRSIKLNEDLEEIKYMFNAASLRVNSIVFYAKEEYGIEGLSTDKVLRPSLTALALAFTYKFNLLKEQKSLTSSWLRGAKIFYNLLSELNLRKSSEMLSLNMVDVYPNGERMKKYYDSHRGVMGKIAKEVKDYLSGICSSKYGVNKRVKTPYSAYLKLIKRIGKENVEKGNFTDRDIREKVTDFIGLQFITKEGEDLDEKAIKVIEKLREKGMKLKEVKYYNVSPEEISKRRIEVEEKMKKYNPDKITVEAKKSGYKAVHLVFEKNLKTLSYPVEVEAMSEKTYEEFKLGEYRHSKYKNEIVDKIISAIALPDKSSALLEFPLFIGGKSDVIAVPYSLLEENINFMHNYFKGVLGNPSLNISKDFEEQMKSLPLSIYHGFSPVFKVRENELSLSFIKASKR